MSEAWPELALENWVDTRETFHLWTQMVGKVQLELRPFLNQWWEVGLTLTARGLTSGLVPAGERSFQMSFDLVDHQLRIEVAGGEVRSLALRERSVSDFYAAFLQALDELDIAVALNPLPSELPDPTPFPQDRAHSAYDASAIGRWWQVMLSVERVIQRFRAGYTGKSSPVLFYWGGFDLNHTRFNGRPVPQAADADPIRGYGENEENFAVGFWPGARDAPYPVIYAYVSPAPSGLDGADISPGPARFEPSLGEFVLPYDALRALPDPDAAALEFFRSAYQSSVDLAGWDRAALEGPTPPGR